MIYLAKRKHLFQMWLDDEEHIFLVTITKFGYTKTEWVREQMREGMKKHPGNLKKEKQDCLNRVKQIDVELENFSDKKEAINDYLQIIFNDFIKFDRINNSKNKNIVWLKNRYSDKIKEILKTPQEVLEYCLNQCKVDEKGGAYE